MTYLTNLDQTFESNRKRCSSYVASWVTGGDWVCGLQLLSTQMLLPRSDELGTCPELWEQVKAETSIVGQFLGGISRSKRRETSLSLTEAC